MFPANVFTILKQYLQFIAAGENENKEDKTRYGTLECTQS